MDRDPILVTLEDGTSCALASVNEGSPFALVFLRHYGCIFCRYQVAQLRPFADLPIVFVGMGSVDETAEFKRRMRSPHRFIADADRELYMAFGVSRGTARQFLNLRAFGRGLRATLAGHYQGRPTADPMQLGAAFVLDGSGKVQWSHHAADASEIVTGSMIREQLARFAQQESAVAREDDPSRNHPLSVD